MIDHKATKSYSYLVAMKMKEIGYIFIDFLFTL